MSSKQHVHQLSIAGLFILGALAWYDPTHSAALQAEDQTTDAAVITHGPIVGGVSDTTAVIFVRASTTTTVQIDYSTDPLFLSGVMTTPGVLAGLNSDYTAHTTVSGLQAATTYFYRMVLEGGLTPLPFSPHFATAPSPATWADFSFALFSDAFYTATEPALVYQAAANEQPAFVVQLGDFDHRNPGQQMPVIIENWRQMHRQELGDYAAGQEFRTTLAATTPFYHIWDDHDYGANNANRTVAWKNMATQAFKEYFPLPVLPNPAGGLWYSIRYAQVELFVLDLRSQRDANFDPDDSNKSMLDGANIPNGQKAWLKAGLLASTARWKFILSSSTWNPHGKQDDSWYLFQTEQQELVQFINTNQITGVILLSGDIHSAGGGIDDGTYAYFPEISVPAQTAKRDPDCTGGEVIGCGLWSQGIITGLLPASYALITVQHDAVTSVDRVILQGKSHQGAVWIQYTLELPAPTPTSTPINTPTLTATTTPNVTSTPTPSLSRTPTLTATLTRTSVPDLIFADGLESGDFSRWSGSSRDGGDLSVSRAAAIVGGWGLQAVLDDNKPLWVADDSPNAEPRYRLRFYFDPNSMTMLNGDAHYILYGYTGAAIVLRVEFRFSNAAYQLRAGIRNDANGWAASPWLTMTDAAHAIEFDWRAAGASGANDGGLTLWIDGGLKANLAGIDNDTRRIDQVRLGALAGIDASTRGAYYFDVFESRRSTYIGP